MNDCPHCPDGHTAPLSRPWGVYVSPDRDSDGQPTHLIVAPSNGAHVAQPDADWLWNLIRGAADNGEPERCDQHDVDACEICAATGLGPDVPFPADVYMAHLDRVRAEAAISAAAVKARIVARRAADNGEPENG